jgi:hypothetical protein
MWSILIFARFYNCALCYMSCYREGLNGKEALWAAKYSGHCSIPSDAAQLVCEEVQRRDLQKKWKAVYYDFNYTPIVCVIWIQLGNFSSAGPKFGASHVM